MRMYLFLIVPFLISGLIHHLVVVKHNLFPVLARPISKGLFGPTKTYRGLIVMVVINSIATWMVSNLGLLTGAIVGLGYSLGELPTSFLKRRAGIAPSRQGGGIKGVVFYFLEQGDSVFGALICANFLVELTIIQNVAIFVSGFLLHLVVDGWLYFTGYKKTLPLPAFLKILSGRKD